MKNIKILRALGGVDNDLIERASQKNTIKRILFLPWLKWAAPAAACLVIAVAIAAPKLFRQPTTNLDTAGGEIGSGGKAPSAISVADGYNPDSLGRIFGLPTSSYTWDEGEGVAADRLATNELRFLMREFGSSDPNVKTVFAIVSVVSVEHFNERRPYGTSEGQIAVCSVDFDFFGDDINPPVNTPIKVKQYLYGGCTNDEQTNLLRIGGAYVLPLFNWQNENFWTICDDLDSLFEVDDKGLIQSHSRHGQLNKYDGQPLAALWDDIAYLYANPILHSRLAENVTLYGYEIAVDNNRIALYSASSGWYGWDGSDKDGFSAQIGADGRIAIATSGFNVFRPVEGMTLPELANEIIKIKRFLGLDGFEPFVYEMPSEKEPIDALEDV